MVIKKNEFYKLRSSALALLALLVLIFLASLFGKSTKDLSGEATDIKIPDYSGAPFVIINNNIPFFDENDYAKETFESYSKLDSLGRCGVAYANVSRELMPTEERGESETLSHQDGVRLSMKGLLIRLRHIYI